MKVYLLTVGSYEFVTEDLIAFNALATALQVDSKWIGNKKVYEPINPTELSLTLVDSDIVRNRTKEEKENTELIEAKNQAKWADDRKKELEKEAADLRCQLKVALKALKDEQEPPKESETQA